MGLFSEKIQRVISNFLFVTGVKKRIKAQKKRSGIKFKFQPRPPEDPQVIKARWEKKKDRIHQLAHNISRLRLNVTKSLKSEDEKEFLTALIIAIIDKTGERIGNDTSASEGHHGVSGFLKKHISIRGSEVALTYTGKSGVGQEKFFSSEKIAKALKKAIRNSPDKRVFTTTEGQWIGSEQVNRYLKEFDISAKDLRGFYVNNAVAEKLQSLAIPETEKERKKLFNSTAKKVATNVGHGCGTCKKHYIVPELSEEYINHGKIIDLKSQNYYKDGGKIQKSKSPLESRMPIKNPHKEFNPNNPDIRYDNGGELPDFANSEKNRIFIPNKITKDELQSIISGKSKTSNGDTIQAILAYIRREEGSNSIDRGTKPEIEEERLKKFINKNNLWYVGELNPNDFLGRGGEHIVYEDPIDKNFVLKTNNLKLYGRWSDYLINLLLNNTFFPDTSYKLIGFKKDEHGNILPVVRQYFVTEAIIADLKDVQKYLFNRGFVKVHPLVNAYRNWDLGIMLGDLHDRNVLVKDDVLFFIDTKFFLSHNADYTYSEGGEIKDENKDFASSEKSPIFVSSKITKEDVNQTITGSRSVTRGDSIQAASNYLRGSESTSPESRSPYFFKGQDEERLREYISKNDLWLPLPDPENKFAEGGEAKVYLYGDYVIKINDAAFYGSWEDYFNSLLIHNLFFPRTSYELIGFSEYKDFDERILYAVVKQSFIKETSATDPEKVNKFMSEIGFINTGGVNYYHPELGLTVKDLHEGNVLTRDDKLFFIDTVFYIKKDKNNFENGGRIQNQFQKQIDDYRKEGIFIKPTDNPVIGSLPISRFNGPNADILPSQEYVYRRGVAKWKIKIREGERPHVLINIDHNGTQRVKDGHHRLKAYEELGFTEIPVIDVNGKILGSINKMSNGGMVFNENLAYLLNDVGGTTHIGEEKGSKTTNGISLYKSPIGSYRYVKYINGIPVSAIQVMSRDGIHGYVSNAYTAKEYRRQGHGMEIINKIKKDFKDVSLSEDLSGSGRAFKEGVMTRNIGDKIKERERLANINRT